MNVCVFVCECVCVYVSDCYKSVNDEREMNLCDSKQVGEIKQE